MTTTFAASKSVEVENWDVTPKVGKVIFFDGELSRELLASEYPDHAPFRLYSSTMTALAGKRTGNWCDVEVTGRTIQRKFGLLVVKVKVTWLDDDGGSTGVVIGSSSGWMTVC